MACAVSVRPLRIDPRPACEAIVADWFPGPHASSDGAPAAGSLRLGVAADGRAHVLVEGLPLAYGRAIVGRLAATWSLPVAWAAFHVEHVEDRRPLCAVPSAQQGQLDPEGRQGPPPRPVPFPRLSTELLDTDKPWRIGELILEIVETAWRLGPADRDVRWALKLPGLPADARAAAAFQAVRTARRVAVHREENGVRVEVVPWGGGREVLFLTRAQAVSAGIEGEGLDADV